MPPSWAVVFQIVDDILDVTATTEQLGKPAGSDETNDKTTFITLYGLDGAKSLRSSTTTPRWMRWRRWGRRRISCARWRASFCSARIKNGGGPAEGVVPQ